MPDDGKQLEQVRQANRNELIRKSKNMRSDHSTKKRRPTIGVWVLRQPQVFRCVVCLVSFLCFFGCQDLAETPKTNIAATDVGFPDGFQPDPNTGTALVNGTAWIRSNFFPNLFEHEHDESEQCPGIPYREEYGGVEISTGRCHEITLAQPCLLDINVGDRIRIIAWHSQLVSEDPEPHEGVFMLAMNDTLLWSETSPIPGGARSFDLTIESHVNIRAGEPVRLHVHNHGANAWNVLSIEKME